MSGIKKKKKRISMEKRLDKVVKSHSKAITAALAKRAEMIASGEVTRKNPLEKLQTKPTSLRLAVNAKCYECCGGEFPRSRIKYCSIFDCPLWSVRPYSKNITKDQCTEWKEASVYEKDSE
jgi:hypothetical protein